MANRYQPLADYLAALPPRLGSVTLTFAELETLVGELPPSVLTQHWWANTGASPHGRLWLDAGWIVEGMSSRSSPSRVTFVRRPPDWQPRPFGRGRETSRQGVGSAR